MFLKMHWKNSTRLGFRWLTKSIETIKFYNRRSCRFYSLSLCEKCPNTELSLLRVFLYLYWIRSQSPYSVQIQENTDQEKLLIWTLLTQFVFLYFYEITQWFQRSGILVYIFGSSHQSCSIKKGVLRNFTKFTGKHLCQSLDDWFCFFQQKLSKKIMLHLQKKRTKEGCLY